MGETTVQFDYFISLALQNNLPWNSLTLILDDLTPTLSKSKDVVKVLLEELQRLHLKLQREDCNSESVKDNSNDNILGKSFVQDDSYEIEEISSESNNLGGKFESQLENLDKSENESLKEGFDSEVSKTHSDTEILIIINECPSASSHLITQKRNHQF